MKKIVYLVIAAHLLTLLGPAALVSAADRPSLDSDLKISIKSQEPIKRSSPRMTTLLASDAVKDFGTERLALDDAVLVEYDHTPVRAMVLPFASDSNKAVVQLIRDDGENPEPFVLSVQISDDNPETFTGEISMELLNGDIVGVATFDNGKCLGPETAENGSGSDYAQCVWNCINTKLKALGWFAGMVCAATVACYAGVAAQCGYECF